ncbi:hypothetical protein [Acinetobacter gerneri]|jgi:type 1 fimbria pilin|uniref:hypothetical protein n=1 Tax=Acinetobacter gerneri TaxID=202952 RepID=UPI0023F1E234|nr:hypothetical protein [Acinetobacter gerneri]MCH4244154.1 hypothetical protein [Acinetobacter gerneri]
MLYQIKNLILIIGLMLSAAMLSTAQAAENTDDESVEEINIVAVELYGTLVAAADVCKISLSQQWFDTLDRTFKENSQSAADYKDMQNRFAKSRADEFKNLKNAEEQLDCDQVQVAVDAETNS